MVSALRVVFTITWDPIAVAGGFYTQENGTNLYLHGAGVSAIYDIAQDLNYKIESSYAEHDDAVDLVANDGADMGALIISQDIRLKKSGLGSTFVYLHPLDYETSYVYFRQPSSNTIRTTVIRPFTLNVWIILMSLMLLVSIIAKQKTAQFKISAASKIILFAFELLVGRHTIHFSLSQVPTSIAISRLIVSFLEIVITALYTAKIASIFIMRETLIKTPSDLLKYGYELNTFSRIHVNRIFEDLNVRKQALKKSKLNWSLNTISDVIQGKPNGPRQLLFAHPDGVYPPALYVLKYDKELCAVSTFKSARKTPRSFYIRRDSFFREKINLRILIHIERGINFRHNAVFKNQYQFNCHFQNTEFQQLTLRQLEIAFVILIVGAAASICCILYNLICQCLGCRETPDLFFTDDNFKYCSKIVVIVIVPVVNKSYI